ncbi:MAG: hypothetical protein K2L90_11340 [Muribaculaceae bacterium]|nr:hypothetical protein [Muribaculaceae bacterium]
MKQNSHQNKSGHQRQRITTAVAIRLACICLLWIALVWLVVRSQPLTAWTLFIVAASAIVVFVPLYKKYVRDTKGK